MIINVLSLPEREDRRNLAIKQINQQGHDERVWFGNKDGELVQRGISQGHKQIILACKNAGMKEAFIVEDDVKFTSPHSIEEFLRNKPEQFDLYLGGISGGTIKENRRVGFFSGLFCYIVHERFYETFLALDETQHIDRSVSALSPELRGKLGRQPDIFCANPIIAITTDGYSDNSKQYMRLGKFFSQYKHFQG